MIEKIVQNYLSNTLEVPVKMEMPETLPPKFILLEKTGSSVENFIYSATIIIQSYAGNLYEAAELNEEVKAAMADLANLPDVGSCQLNSDYNFTDTSIKRHRYQAVFDLIY